MLDSVIDFVINGGKRKITKPIFIKEFTKESSHLKELLSLQKKVKNDRIRKQLNRDINFVKAGIQGEANVAFELKHSLLPILCLHDIHLTYKDYSVQIDFIIITKNSILLFETKKLNGDIEINRDGDFIRLFKNKYGKIYKREGIYSPISQNERHVRILEKILKEKKLIRRMPIKSYVIIANPKTIINKNRCPKNIEQNIYKYDQITNVIKKELNDQSNPLDVREKILFDIANFLLENHKPKSNNYEAIYSIDKKDYIDLTSEISQIETDPLHDKEEIVEKLKQYRLETARSEGLKAFMIFTNKEIEELIEKNPKTKAELLEVKGFGKKKVNQYGGRILEILNGYGKC